MNLCSNLIPAIIFVVMASTLGNPTSSNRLVSSSESSRLTRPINIPNLSGHNRAFQSTPSLNSPHNIKDSNNKSRNYFTRKAYHPEERRESLAQKTINKPKYNNEGLVSSDNSLKFSSKYSTTTDGYKSTRESSEKDVIEVAESTEIADLIDTDRSRSKSSVKSSDDDKYESYSDSYSTHSYFEDLEEDHGDIRQFSDSNEPKDAEESEISTTTSEPYSKLRDSTSFQKYRRDEFENDETSITSEEEKDEKDEKRSVDDYHDYRSNYHSVQTPLKEIKFRGPHSVKDEFESDKIRTRLNPIRRRPTSHNWPYSKAQIKEDAEKLNEISDEKEDSDEWKSEEFDQKSKLRGLEKAIEKDQSIQNVGKHNDKIRRKEKQKALNAVEAKDHQSPFYQTLKHYKVADEGEEVTKPTVGYKPKPKPNLKNEKIWSTSSTLIKQKATPFQKLFTDQAIKSFKPFNTTKELTSKFQGEFLGPIVFNKNKEKLKANPTEKAHPKAHTQKEKLRSTFLDDLEKKETIDQQNLTKEKFQQAISAIGDNEMPSESFNYQEESDEMYNQILSNIQSIFGERTQKLKASGRRGASESHQETIVEEDNLLTWSVPPRKRESPKQETLKNVPTKENHKKVKAGSPVESFKKSIFSSDIFNKSDKNKQTK